MNKTYQTILKGYAILFIMLHNFCHLKGFGLPQENEMSFNSINWQNFTQHVTNSPIMLIPDLLSFAGWIGVPVFVFLSGFGLTKKYELSPTYCDRPTTGGGKYINNQLDAKKYIIKSWKKLVLMIAPAFFFLTFMSIINDRLISFLIHSVFSVFLINNIITGVGHSFANSLLPPYWYLGMTLQLYLFYLVWRRNDPKKIFILTIVLALVLQVVISPDLLNHPMILRYVRVNCFSWLPIFCLGCIFGQSKYDIQQWKPMFSLIIFVMSLALIVVVNYNYYLWLFMPYFALPLFFSLTNLTIKVRLLNKIVMYIGTISTYIFLSHPIVLKIRDVLGFGNDGFVLQMILYVISTIIISYIYRYFHKIIIKKYN